jgi:exopolysaccharide biosynthesis polyprenyl glycosylphosphotransferase
MLGRKQELFLKLQQFTDSVILALGFWLAYVLRTRGTEPPFNWQSIPSIESYYSQILVMVAFTPLVLDRLGFYNLSVGKSVFRTLTQAFQAMVIMVAITAVVALFTRQTASGVSRSVLIIFFGIAIVFLVLRSLLTTWWLRGNVSVVGARERVLLVGPPEDVQRFVDQLPPDQAAALEVVERIDISTEPVENLVAALHEKSVSRVIFAAAHVHLNRIEEAVNACEIEGVEAWLWANFIQTTIARPSFDAMGGKPMLVFRCTPEVSWALFAKSVIDRLGAAILLCFAAIPMVIAWIGIRIASPGPAIFSQMRSGRHGRPFKMYKFRTMCLDAEAQKASLMDQNQMSGPVFKIERDPRIFAFGAFLRKWSIDELPQLINVLKGDMSLVGPRPLPVKEVENFADTAHRRRLSMLPGLTCLWQVSGRNDIRNFDDWVELDLKYIDNWSLWLDLTILLRTVPAVFFGSGAR